MNKTFSVVETEEVDYLFLALPDTNLFNVEVVFDYGSDLEKLYLEKYGKEVFGITHLTEHLCFKSPVGYSSDELLRLFKKHGNRNASTSYTHTKYFFNTISKNTNFALDALIATAFNDFDRVTDEEFESEKKVIISEVGQYGDNKQTIFNLGVKSALTGSYKHDNILGDVDVIKDFTLDECKDIRRLALQEAKKFIFVLYDPNNCTYTEDELKSYIDIRISKLDIKKTDKCIGKEVYYEKRNKVLEDVYVPSESNRFLVNLTFDIETNVLVRSLANYYVSALANENSLYNIIRDKHGLTYGISLYTEDIQNKQHTALGVDVAYGKEELLFKLIEEAIVASVDAFDEEVYAEVRYNQDLRATMKRANLVTYKDFVPTWVDNKELLMPLMDKFKINIDDSDDLLYAEWVSYDKVKAYLLALKDMVVKKNYRGIYSSKIKE